MAVAATPPRPDRGRGGALRYGVTALDGPSESEAHLMLLRIRDCIASRRERHHEASGCRVAVDAPEPWWRRHRARWLPSRPTNECPSMTSSSMSRADSPRGPTDGLPRRHRVGQRGWESARVCGCSVPIPTPVSWESSYSRAALSSPSMPKATNPSAGSAASPTSAHTRRLRRRGQAGPLAFLPRNAHAVLVAVRDALGRDADTTRLSPLDGKGASA